MAKKKRRIVLNLQETRAKKETVVIIDPQGREFDLGGLSVDAYLKILEFESEYGDMKEGEGADSTSQTQLLIRTKDFITSMLPEFDVDSLFLDEIFAVFAAIQEGITDAVKADAEKETGGESEGN